jgi:2-C-methyl-D-erythritol 4-phosphate cytidylyltransferase
LIEAVAAKLRSGSSAVIPALPVVDTIKRVGEASEVVATVDRSVLRAVQTPQGFRRATLAAAHAGAADDHTDDAGLAEQAGVRVDTVPGDDLAFKITRPFDLAIAEAILAARANGGRDGEI